MRLFCLFFLALLMMTLTSFSQRLSLGLNLKTNVTNLYRVKINQETVVSGFSNITYDVPTQPQTLFSMPSENSNATNIAYLISGLGILSNLDYGRYNLSFEPGIYTERFDYKLYFINQKREVETVYSKIAFFNFELPTLLGYSLFYKNRRRLVLEAGVSFVIPISTYEINYTQESWKTETEVDENILLDLIDISSPYLNGFAGIGLRTTYFSYSIRYYHKIKDETASIGYFSLNFNSFIDYSRIRKHYIYID